jgi:hypothetical protein
MCSPAGRLCDRVARRWIPESGNWLEELAHREPADAQRIRPVRGTLENQRDDLLEFAGVPDDKQATIAHAHEMSEPVVREACALRRLSIFLVDFGVSVMISICWSLAISLNRLPYGCSVRDRVSPRRGTTGRGRNGPNPACYLGDTDIVRASKRQHPVQGSGSKGNLGRLGSAGARSKGIANHTFVSPRSRARSPDRRFDLGSQIVAAGFWQAMWPRSAIIRRWRPRCAGAISADALATAPARGGTMTAASG